ncbi:MAG: ATP-binding protein [Candidatus Sumerlaeota bacterium]
MFSNLSKIIAQTTNIDDLVLSSVQVIQSVLLVKNCSIMLIDSNDNALVLRASTTIPQEEWSQIRVERGKGIAGRVALTGRPIMVSESRVHQKEELKEGESARDKGVPTAKRYETDSFISVPLQSGKSVLGVINITDHVKKRMLTAIDLEMLEAIARLIASAVSSHYLWVRTREAREHLSHVFDGLPLGMFTINAQGRLSLCNKAARQYLSVDQNAELNQPWKEYFHELIKPHISKALNQIGRGGQSYSAEFQVPESIDGETHSVRISALEAEDLAALEQNHVLFLVEDLQQMQELGELRRSDQLKSTFLSIISHELRTPLASIKGAIHLLNQMAPPDMRQKADRLFAILHRNSDRLARLVNNILDVMDLESDNLNLYPKRVDLHELVSRVAKRFEAAEFEKDIEWTMDFDAEKYELYVDESRFGQVVDHLIENAVKFTQEGGSIKIQTKNKGGMWVLQVANSGREIPQELREKIFTRFYQADGTLTRDSGGTGLGLYLCREILRKHRGEILVDPDFKNGTRMKVLLPESNIILEEESNADDKESAKE